MFIYTGTTISFQSGGKFHTAHNSHPAFQQIVELTKAGKLEEATRIIDLKTVITQALDGSKAELKDSEVYYDGQLVKSSLSRRIITMAKEGFDAKPLLAFLENLMENPSKRAVDELYDFLEASKLPITEDGHFLAYKSVRQDFTDHHTGTMDNSVGAVVEMPRNAVDEDKDRTCSAGLHFAAHNYAKGFGRGGRMVVLKINPRDVVAIPSDYNNEKGRACRYEILEEVKRNDKKLVDAGFVATGKKNTVTFEEPKYVPQIGNHFDVRVWHKEGFGLHTFIATAKDFPVDRDKPYILERKSNNKCYRGEFYFLEYQEKHDNLVFARRGHDGEWEKYVTISDVNDWYIQFVTDES
jgi:hypothetical protein